MKLITPFDPWKSDLCSCPPKYSLSGYTGCSHGCLYCYASSYIRDFPHPRPKKDYLERLEKEIRHLPPSATITMANSSDPYLPLEENLELTRTTLAILSHYDIRLAIVTKSSLIMRDLSLLKKCNKKVVAISLTTVDEKLSRNLEPFAPTPAERLKTVEQLSKYMPVIVRFDPLIYPLTSTDANIQAVVRAVRKRGARHIITSTYKAKPDNLKRLCAQFPELNNTLHTLYKDEGKTIGGYRYLRHDLRHKLIMKVKACCVQEGLDFSCCREGFKHLNTTICDGSSSFTI